MIEFKLRFLIIQHPTTAINLLVKYIYCKIIWSDACIFGCFLLQVIMNLSQVLDKQKEKLEKMRAFTKWRLQHAEAKEEVGIMI